MQSSNSTIYNFIWRFAERCGAQLVSFIVSIVLARILVPEDYGTIALVTVFTAILQVFVDSGFGFFFCILFQSCSLCDFVYRNVCCVSIHCCFLWG